VQIKDVSDWRVLKYEDRCKGCEQAVGLAI